MKKKPTLTKSQTDFARLDKMKDEDIDLFDAPEMFAKAIKAWSQTAHKNPINFARG